MPPAAAERAGGDGERPGGRLLQFFGGGEGGGELGGDEVGAPAGEVDAADLRIVAVIVEDVIDPDEICPQFRGERFVGWLERDGHGNPGVEQAVALGPCGWRSRWHDGGGG